MRQLIRNNLSSLSNFIHLSFIQGSNAVIQILLSPIIIHIVGLGEFGHVMVANSYATLVGMLINYGSNQSGIKDVATHQSDRKLLSETFYTIFYTRGILFIISIASLPILFLLDVKGVSYLPFAITIILSEVMNPFFFYLGTEKLFIYNLTNLISKTCSALAILFFVRSQGQAHWVNFYLGLFTMLSYSVLTVMLTRQYNLTYYRVGIQKLWQYLGTNFYLAANTVSVQLQQSFFLFTVASFGDPLVLGAYSLCDKVVWSFRILIISFTNAVYPKAAILFKTDMATWKRFKKKMNLLLFIIFACTAVLLFAFADFIVLVITGDHNILAAAYIRSISLVPLVAAANCLNVIDLLMRNRYRYIFIIALILLAISVTVSKVFIIINNSLFFGYYPVIVEIFSFPLYMYFIRRSSRHR